jgi:hypothetical protein
MKNKKVEKILRQKNEFSARGSNCNICKNEFRDCEHSIEDVMNKFDEMIFNARYARVIHDRNKSNDQFIVTPNAVFTDELSNAFMSWLNAAKLAGKSGMIIQGALPDGSNVRISITKE